MESIQRQAERGEMEAISITPKPYLTGKVVVLNGLSGCGKTMLSPIIGALPRVELMQYSYVLEYVCQLKYLGRIETDVASALTGLITDLHLYNIMMGRETNFRPADLSSVFRNPRPMRYFLRLFQAGDEAVINRGQVERPILLLTTHNLLPISLPLFEALGPRVLFVELVRHPLYRIIQHSIAMEREQFETGGNSRSFLIMFEYKGVRLPWFAYGWEEVFLTASPIEKAIYVMDYMTKQAERLGVFGAGYGRDDVLVIPFERFVIDPLPYMRRLETALSTKMDSCTRRMMRKQKVPRKMYAEGIDLERYKQYGWEPPEKNSNEAKEFERRRQFAAERASPEAMEILDQLCVDYEAKYLKK